MNNDDFWTSLATGHTNTVLAGSMDAHLTGMTIDESFGTVRTLVASKQASVMRVASLGDLTQFLKRADGKLVHKSTNDLWSYSKDADGNFLVERLFDDEGEPLKG